MSSRQLPDGTGSSPASAPSTPADQQARIDVLLLEIIDVLARLISSHDNGET